MTGLKSDENTWCVRQSGHRSTTVQVGKCHHSENTLQVGKCRHSEYFAQLDTGWRTSVWFELFLYL